ncbi:hypothetical protein [Streptodolium elevatio]
MSAVMPQAARDEADPGEGERVVLAAVRTGSAVRQAARAPPAAGNAR